MYLLDVALIFSILSCSLVGGFIFTYAIVVMPGLSSLSDKDFLRAFQVTDAIIQDNQPLFMFTWVGSMVAMFMMIVVSSVRVELAEAWPIVLISFTYLVGGARHNCGIPYSFKQPYTKPYNRRFK